jgi:hypothetical protein
MFPSDRFLAAIGLRLLATRIPRALCHTIAAGTFVLISCLGMRPLDSIAATDLRAQNLGGIRFGMTPDQVKSVALAQHMGYHARLNPCPTAQLHRQGVPSGNCITDVLVDSPDGLQTISVSFYQDLPAAPTRMIAVSIVYRDRAIRTVADWNAYVDRLHTKFGKSTDTNLYLDFCQISTSTERCTIGDATTFGLPRLAPLDYAQLPDVQVDAIAPGELRAAIIWMVDYRTIKAIDTLFKDELDHAHTTSPSF